MQTIVLIAVVVLVSNVAVVIGALMIVANYAVKWRRREEEKLQATRQQHVAELTKATDAARKETLRYSVMQKELYLDSQMLQVACQELAAVRDSETGGLLFDGDWRVCKKYLRRLVCDHNRTWNQANDEQLRRSYKVAIEPVE